MQLQSRNRFCAETPLAQSHPEQLPPAREAMAVVPAIDPRLCLFAITSYFLLHAIIRCFISPNVELDESEQVVFAQSFAWTYGKSLPLYTWLQMLCFSVFGQSIAGLTILKNGILLGLYVVTYSTARRITGNPLAGVTAGICLLLTPQILWESQRDLTHSTLACMLVVGSLSAFERVHSCGRASGYALFGFVAGLGLLTKFNFALWLLALVAAGLSIVEFRRTILHRKMLISAATALCVLLPVAFGIMDQHGFLADSATRLRIQQSRSAMELLGLGIWRVVIGTLAACAIPATVLGLLARSTPPLPNEHAGKSYITLLWRAWAIIAIMVVLAIPLFSINAFHQRWLQPLLIAFPILAAILVNGRLDVKRTRILAGLGAAAMLLVLVVLPLRTICGWGGDEPYLRPYPALAEQLRAKLPPNAFIMTEPTLLGGNLRLALGKTPVRTPEIARSLPLGFDHCVLVWDASRLESPPQRLVEWAATTQAAKTPPWTPEFITAPYPAFPAKEHRLAVVQLW